MPRTVTAQALRAMLADGAELALADVRDEGVFAKSHLFYAISLPLARLELIVDRLIPRRATRIVLCDADDGLALAAAKKLEQFGYTNVATLAGGIEAWRRSGGELFSGVHVPSKAFGEHIEHHDGTPSISPEELKALVDRGTDMVILDSRPLTEYQRMSIPGAMDCPGAELVHRVFEVAPRPEQLVVVNCAGRTRSIIGAQSLRNAGIPNKVIALRNGTMGWNLAGFETASGKSNHAPRPSAAALARAQAAAAAVAKRFGIKSIDTQQVDTYLADTTRTTYLLDVRTPDEYLAGHLAGSHSAPGGQLVQETDRYVGTRNTRLILIDTEGVRATMTASWLLQLGWPEVYVCSDALANGPIESGPEPQRTLGLDALRTSRVTASVLASLLASKSVALIDLATSLEYRRGHIAGAAFAVRSRFAGSLGKLDHKPYVVLTSPDGVLAQLAAPEAAAILKREVLVLDGGSETWQKLGYALDTEAEAWLDTPDDVYYLPYDNRANVQQAMRDYITWELALVEQLKREGIRFRTFPA